MTSLDEKIENMMKDLRKKIFSMSSQDMRDHMDVIGPLMFYQAFTKYKETRITDEQITQLENLILSTTVTKMDDVINISRFQIQRAAMKMIQEMQKS